MYSARKGLFYTFEIYWIVKASSPATEWCHMVCDVDKIENGFIFC